MNIDAEIAVYYREAANRTIKTLETFVVTLIIALLTVFLPLAYAFPQFTEISLIIIQSIPIVITPAIVFFSLKYREYKYCYMVIIVKNLIKEIIRVENSSDNLPTNKEVAHKIANKTMFKEKDVLKLLNAIYESESK